MMEGVGFVRPRRRVDAHRFVIMTKGDFVRMKFAYLLPGALFGAAMTLLAAPTAHAQTHDLYFAQAGAALTYSYAEVRVLYGAVTARKYDGKITAETIEELRRALSSARRQADRANKYLPRKMKKFGPLLSRLRKSIAKCEKSLAQVEVDIDEQMGAKADNDVPTELGRPLVNDGRAAKKKSRMDRKVLRNSVGWLANDIRVARAKYKEAAIKVARRALASPRPRGRRPK